MAFQVSKVLRDSGLLAAVNDSGKAGTTADAAAQAAGVRPGLARALLEAGIGFGVVEQQGGKFTCTPTGFHVLADEMTRANMDFIHDVCYQGMFHLDETVRTGTPAGLPALDTDNKAWPNIYDALADLPESVRKSWFAFDHQYSDFAFPEVLPMVLASKPKTLLDVGGNTGRWATQCVAADPDLRVTIFDLPGQLETAKQATASAPGGDRIGFEPVDLLDQQAPFPRGFDLIWMSQFLVCFSEDQIVSILRRAAEALEGDARLLILETFWDRQDTAIAAYVMQAASLYFACMANGCSRMYSSRDMLACVAEAGLVLEEQIDDIGLGHTLLRCRRG